MILTVGSVNMDLILDVGRLPIRGETVFGNTLKYIPGGKGANQAVAASRLGGNVFFLGKVGNDNFGKQLTEFLHSENLKPNGLEKDSSISGMAVITVDSKGNNTIVVLPGANSKVDKELVNKHIDLIKQSNVIITQLEIPFKTVEYLLLTSKKLNKLTIFNPSPILKIPHNLLKLADYLIVNETELSTLVGVSKVIEGYANLVEAAKGLKSGVVIVTLGDKGVFAIEKGKVLRAEGIKVKAVDTTAAGDCFVGALAVQIDKGRTLKEALDFANRAATMSVQKWGASNSLPYLSELRT